MAKEEEQEHYAFDQTVSEQREDSITNQLVAFNLTHTTALPLEQHDPLPLHLYLLDPAGTLLGGLLISARRVKML